MISILTSAIQQSSQPPIHSTTITTTSTKINSNHNNNPTSTQNIKKQSAIERLISQIKSIFPHLGEGYIETALACYNHDIEQTTLILMESEAGNTNELHPRLRAMDKSLPARKKAMKEQYTQRGNDSNDNDTNVDKEEEEARKIQKERIEEMVKRQEEEAYKLGIAMAATGPSTTTEMDENDLEYNDDYDDQYDGVGVGTTNADSGLYDVDYDAIKTYNRVTKEMEADRLFWEESRNDNRRNHNSRNVNNSKKGAVKNDGSDDHGDDQDVNGGGADGLKKYRGPDKGKGGRLIGPDGKYLPFPKSRKKGAGKARGNNQNSKDGGNNGSDEKQKESSRSSANNKDGKKKDDLTKIQKRRKNDNKAKIGNHHRKERALKKTGM